MPDRVVGLVLAAGEGCRFGMPKALARSADGTPWCARAVDTLVAGGCEDVVVVLGAMGEAALHLVPPRAEVVLARDWAEGTAASLRAGLRATDASVALVTLVDLPGLVPEAVARVLARSGEATVARATYAGRPGHPVAIGRRHWDAFTGDRRPGEVLAGLGAVEVDCTALGGGDDVDHSLVALG
ncbi:molybdopterin-guanine dinucleotide biosynthesis protein MobA [Aeromicrobium flavum]|uniref:Molybdopterin-guanine dinucleotide biosynthesis protein MobA n=1 Tax=Aeromicrobium flavum TaxID=416568 RepID=A0A512HVD5_9ACTN|nr:NTP transferase domain-containing protein [Aeromicrobium flavum]GEO89409.1 molybdopterin-guanine dinucleotide biosynthesis protein MobA [Aeromicrobium flavum]